MDLKWAPYSLGIGELVANIILNNKKIPLLFNDKSRLEKKSKKD